LCGALPQSSRYVIYVALGVLGLYFHLSNQDSFALRRIFTLVLVGAVLAATFAADRRQVAFFSLVKQQWRACYLHTEDLVGCNHLAGFTIFSHPPERTRLQEKLQFLKRAQLNLFLP